MKKAFVLAATTLAALFGLITLVKMRSSESVRIRSSASTDPGQDRVRDFWQIYNDATARRRQGDFLKATELYRHALELDPQHEDSLYYLSASLSEIGEYAAAQSTLRELLRVNPESGRGWAQLGNALSELAPGARVDFSAARKAYERNLQLNQEQAGTFLQLGRLELNQGSFTWAEDYFRTAATFGSPEAKFLLGYTLLLQNHPEEAAKLFRKVMESYLADRKIVAKGVLSEGDVLPEEGKTLTALERAGVTSMLLLYWSSFQAGKSPEQAAADIHLAPRTGMNRVLAPVRKGLKVSGGRAAWGDFDRDGKLDLIVGGPGPVMLYRNERGQLVDVTATSGLNGIRDVWEPFWADIDNDGAPDLYLVRPGFVGRGRNQLFRNDGKGFFRELTPDAGLDGLRSTIRACFLDADGDGKLDLVEVGASDGQDSAVRLFLNTGKRFLAKSENVGFDDTGTAVDCAVGDYDGDGKPDLFIQFWGKPLKVYRNVGHGRFLDSTADAGLQGIRTKGFSLLLFDYDRDGLPDLLVSDYAPLEDVARAHLDPGFHPKGQTPRLFHNLGNGKFQEVTSALGLNRSYGTIQALAADLDGDGWTDLVLVNGSIDAQRLETSVFLQNVQGKSFHEWVRFPAFGVPGNFVGAAVGDFNGDGAPDLYFTANPLLRAQSPGGVFVNVLAEKRAALQTK